FNLAWCTGQAAGIGSTVMERDLVLGWFGVGAPGGGPRHLLVSDVAAEGLDLQRAARVIHYDLPWTPARLEQREGRSVRLGSRHREVQVVRFGPPAGLERALRLEATLDRKSRLPAAVGVGAGGHHVWRWRADIAAELADVHSVSGVAKVMSNQPGLLAGVALYSSEGPPLLLSASAGWLDRSGAWSEDSDLLTDRFRSAAAAGDESTVGTDELRMYLELLTPIIRNRIASTRGRRWLTPDPGCSARAVAERLRLLIRDAAKLRQDTRLLELEAALAFVAGGHTAGEERLLDKLVGVPARDLLQALSSVVPQPPWTGVEVRLTGLIIFGPVAT
ncbi:MAG TPA: C-terminal helicase domain-containing protein, partial [Gemmatimonadales bacterium]|nr:C-terminal helicase domain-containing protein [Gemmatimonadales bacterium]